MPRPPALHWSAGWTRWWAGCGPPWTSVPQAPPSAQSCRPAARRPGAPSALTPSQSWAQSNPTAGSGSTGHVGAPADLKGEAARGPVGAGPWAPTPEGGCLLGAGLSWPSNDGREGLEAEAGSASHLHPAGRLPGVGTAQSQHRGGLTSSD